MCNAISRCFLQLALPAFLCGFCIFKRWSSCQILRAQLPIQKLTIACSIYAANSEAISCPFKNVQIGPSLIL